MKSLIIHGRQPALGRAELESLCGASSVLPFGKVASLLDIASKDIHADKLGGAVKTAKILTSFDHSNWKEIRSYLEQTLPKHLGYIPEGKIILGISVYGLDIKPAVIQATALGLKKIIRAHSRSARIVPNVKNELNSAQVLHNKLTSANGMELLVVSDSRKTILAQTTQVQDIEAYARRDQMRPYRDTKVGMLPPKLAQTIINLTKPGSAATILDPFCGTGVILQEALLMDLVVIGTDIDSRMVEYTQKNIDWLDTDNKEVIGCYVADATSHKWSEDYSCIASETYLGRPFSAKPDVTTLNKVIADCDTIHRKFLANIARQISPDFRMCLAVPAWKIQGGFRHLPTLDHLEKLGYNRLSFAHAKNSELIYHRPTQHVARELLVLEKT